MVLYRWPAPAAVGRIVPKERLYAAAGVGGDLRQRFVDEVQRITWAYKLGEESVRLSGDDTVPEIQIFVVELKSQALSDQVLLAVDKAIPSPILFEAHRSQGPLEIRLSAANKTPGPRGPKVSHYVHGPWLPGDAARQPLPVALDLAGLHHMLLASIAPVAGVPGESTSGLLDRVATVRRLEREALALERRLRSEGQFNRQVEIRRQLRQKQAELVALTSKPGDRGSEATTWRS